MNEIQQAALAMGIEPPLFPTLMYLSCAGCAQRIEGEAYDDEAGWLCPECALAPDVSADAADATSPR